MSEKNKVFHPQRDAVTSHQINNLISVGSFALHALNVQRDEDTAPGGVLDGGTKLAAEAVFIKTMDKLDGILNDTDRWSFELHDSLEKKLEALYVQNTEFLAEQTKAAARISLPSFVYRPTLVKISDNEWLAHLGSLGDIEHSIVGLGATPAQALESFDAMFTGDPLPPHLIDWLAMREAKPPPERKPRKPSKKKDWTVRTLADAAPPPPKKKKP